MTRVEVLYDGTVVMTAEATDHPAPYQFWSRVANFYLTEAGLALALSQPDGQRVRQAFTDIKAIAGGHLLLPPAFTVRVAGETS